MLVVILSLVVLSLGAEISKTDSFKNVVHHFCGQWCGSLNSIIVILYSFGSCVTYIIITGDQFDKCKTFVSCWSSLMFIFVFQFSPPSTVPALSNIST